MDSELFEPAELQRLWERRNKRRKLHARLAEGIRRMPSESVFEFGQWWLAAVSAFTPNTKGFTIVLRALLERWPRGEPDKIMVLFKHLRICRHAMMARVVVCADRHEQRVLMRCESFVTQTLLRLQPW